MMLYLLAKLHNSLPIYQKPEFTISKNVLFLCFLCAYFKVLKSLTNSIENKVATNFVKKALGFVITNLASKSFHGIFAFNDWGTL